MSYSRIPTTRLLRVTVAVRLTQGTAPMDSCGTDSYYAIPTMRQSSAAVAVSGVLLQEQSSRRRGGQFLANSFCMSDGHSCFVV